MNRIEIQKPKEGAQTLVAQISALRVDEIVGRIRRLGDGDPSPRDIDQYLAGRFHDMSEGMRRKINLLARGLTPPDDFALEDVTDLEQPDDRTILARLPAECGELQVGELLFLRSERWMLAELEDGRAVLKRLASPA